jgi:NADPH2:quinone reductase
MKAIRFARHGGPDVLEYVDVDLRPPGEGQVRVRHTAIGVNFAETSMRAGRGHYGVTPPAGLGSEAVGIIDALGEGVVGLAVGERVAYWGGLLCAYAEAANVPVSAVLRLPDGLADEVAAAALSKGMTARYLLKASYPVQPGETILFHAAAGGVGQIATQWARHIGATVIGGVGSDHKFALVKAAGCDHVVNTRNGGWAAQVRELTGGEGVAAAYDSVGKDTFLGSLDCLRRRGFLISFGESSGPIPPLDVGLLRKNSVYVTRQSMANHAVTQTDVEEMAADLFAVLMSGAVKIHIGQRMKLAEAAKMHEALESRSTLGASVLIP